MNVKIICWVKRKEGHFRDRDGYGRTDSHWMHKETNLAINSLGSVTGKYKKVFLT